MTQATLIELDRRENHGITVSLLWSRPTNELTVRVHDAALEEEFEVPAAPAEALEVFNHPFAYAATREASVRYLFTEELAAA
jgi:hypothetical protein